MARKVLSVYYSWHPETKKITFWQFVAIERLILITNVTKGIVMYNFSDPSRFGSTTYETQPDGRIFTTVTFNYDTTTMSSSDEIQIVVDTKNEAFQGSEEMTDPVGKLRVSTPQNLIDTDFEYGNQISKWEQLGTTNNRPSSYNTNPQLNNVTAMSMPSGSNQVTVSLTTAQTAATTATPSLPSTGFVTYTVTATTNFTVGQYVTISGAATAGYNGTFQIISIPSATSVVVANATTGTGTFTSGLATAGVLAVGTPITVQDSFLVAANGNYVIESATLASGSAGTSTFVYTAKAQNTTSPAITSIFDSNRTVVFQTAFYSGAAIGGTPTITFSGAAITVTTTVPHGLALGNEISVIGTTATTNAPNGNFAVATIVSPVQFIYYANATPTGTVASGAVYPRHSAIFAHRPYDGGVFFSSNASSNNMTASRQTRRYFHYQSGKSIQMSTGTNMQPYFNVDNVTSAGLVGGSIVTVQTKEQHNIRAGVSVKISGANAGNGALDINYNGTFVVTAVTGLNKFQYALTNSVSSLEPAGPVAATASSWYGSTQRAGIYDLQNGAFWEYDGTDLYAVKRSSTLQIQGRATATNGSTNITQTDANFLTSFSTQLVPGDWIVIRGSSYRVTDIQSDTSLTISPAYRGVTATYLQVTKTVDSRVSQLSFNLDTLNGHGETGYTIDLSKVQMWYIDYSWYGAGYIRWGVRAAEGNIVYAHKVMNNNVNNLAWARSGNLPARYENTTTPVVTTLTSSVGATDTSLNVTSTLNSAGNYAFPSSGTLLIKSSTSTGSAGTYEYVNYTGISATSFTGLTRAQSGNTAGTTMSITAGTVTSTALGSATGLQVGQRIISSAFPINTYITAINGTTLTFCQAATTSLSGATVYFPPMGATTGQVFTYSSTNPISVELAYPQHAPMFSHWGTSAIMDGAFTPDKSLLFTYGQTTPVSLGGVGGTTSATNAASSNTTLTLSTANTNIVPGMLVTGTGVTAGTYIVTANSAGTSFTVNQNLGVALNAALTYTGATTKALLSIRVAPSIDNGQISTSFGGRELINRMQLLLNTLDVALQGSSTGNLLVRAYLNGYPYVAVSGTFPSWTNAVGGAFAPNSSLAQITDYSSVVPGVGVIGGEVTGGFFVSSTGSVDISQVRDLGNSILGGASTSSQSSVYPDGPDTLTITVTNVNNTAASVLGRISWTEAQA